MKVVRNLFLCLSLMLLLGGCSVGADPQPASDAPESSAPLQDIVLEGVDAPGLGTDVGGFEYSLWGDSISDVAAAKPGTSWTLVDNNATLGGFPCRACYEFGEDGLLGGYYLLRAGEDYGPALFRSVLDYLTGLYGTPSQLLDEKVRTLTAAPDNGLGSVMWAGTPTELRKADTVSIALYGLTGGEVRVAFTASAAR